MLGDSWQRPGGKPGCCRPARQACSWPQSTLACNRGLAASFECAAGLQAKLAVQGYTCTVQCWGAHRQRSIKQLSGGMGSASQSGACRAGQQLCRVERRGSCRSQPIPGAPGMGGAPPVSMPRSASGAMPGTPAGWACPAAPSAGAPAPPSAGAPAPTSAGAAVLTAAVLQTPFSQTGAGVPKGPAAEGARAGRG